MLVHYCRSAGLMTRRSARASREEEICGPGFAPTQACSRVVQLEQGELSCSQPRATISSIVGATYGSLTQGQEHRSFPYCSEGPAGKMETNPECRVDVSSLIAAKCIGKASCSITLNEKWGFPADPCPGQFKHVQVHAECGTG
jgi:hypothetical protein